MSRIVPNEKAKVHNLPYKIAIIGEAPGATEDQAGRPFSGGSGQLLDRMLNISSILRSACLVGNICQVRPPNNDLSCFSWSGDEIQSGLAELKHDIQEFDPNLVILLGASALRAAGRSESVSALRGTFFVCSDLDSPFYGRKCMATYHPAYCLRVYDTVPIVTFDLKRARQEGMEASWNPPVRDLQVGLSFQEICNKLDWLATQPRLGFDIEGYGTTGVSCLSFSPHPKLAIGVPFTGHLDGSFWSVEEEIVLWKKIALILTDPKRTIIIQNGIYDVFVMAWRHKILIRCKVEDTMIAAWEYMPEFPKSLGFLCSIFTWEEYYKDERTSEDRMEFWRYNAKDSAVLPEIFDAVVKQFKPHQLAHYNFNMLLFPAIMYMQLRGTRFDADGARKFGAESLAQAEQYEAEITKLHARCPNVQSPKQVAEFLYGFLALPKQFKKGKGGTMVVTTDKDALYALALKVDSPALKLVLKSRKYHKMESDARSLYGSLDLDGRVRCSLSPVGTESARFTSYESPSGSGRNLQNITKKLRVFFRGDSDCHYAQLDLSGADGWTVAARCDEQGDSTMWDDYMYGLKPAKILFLMVYPERFGYKTSAEINQLDRATLKALCKSIDSDGKDYDMYFGCKAVQHGSNYMMQEYTMSENILKRSEGDVFIPPPKARLMQMLYLSRYPGVQHWWKWVAQQLTTKQGIFHASGHYRRFNGRAADKDTLRSALAEEPQGNTTYAVKLAIARCWYDKDNRKPDGSLIVEPLHTVHDSFNPQFRIHDVDFAKPKLHAWFDNPIQIGNKIFSIPFEGAYGPSWGELPNPL